MKSRDRNMTGSASPPGSLSFTLNGNYNFGSKAIGSSSDVTIQLHNPGGVPVTSMASVSLSAPFGFKGGGYPGIGGTCGLTLTNGAYCDVVVTYAPTVLGAHNDILSVTYHNGATNTSANSNVFGTGVNPALLTISDGPSYDYGTLTTGSVGEHTFTIDNTGDVTATPLLALPFSPNTYRYKGNFYPGTGGTCGSSLTANNNCTIVVEYVPTAIGTHNNTIKIAYNDGAQSQQADRPVTGQGLSPATLSFAAPSSIDFGTLAIGSTNEDALTLQNTGSFTATGLESTSLSLPFRFKGGSYPGTGGTCSTTLDPLNSCSIFVEYLPTALVLSSDSIVVDYHDGTNPQTATAPVQGTGGLPANLSITDGPLYDYGSHVIGSTTNKTFTISNSGGVTANPVMPAALAPPFLYVGGTFPGTAGTCSSSLAAGASCTVVVSYSPTVAGIVTNPLRVDYMDGVNMQFFSIDLKGTATSPAVITVSDGPTYDYGIVTLGSTSEKTFTLTNIGSVSASAMDGTGLVLPFTFKGGVYPGNGGNCGANLSGSGTCTIVVTFNPSALGTFNDSIQIDYFDGTSNQNTLAPIKGTAQASIYCIDKLANAPFAGGTGTDPDPYTICTPTQLMQIGSHLSSNFELRDNLDLSSTTFIPFGGVSAANEFTGAFDGNNFTISSVSYASSNNLVGFFGETTGSASIKNLVLSGINISGNNYVGGLVGRMTGGTITNVHIISGSVAGLNSAATDDGVGGLVGRISSTVTVDQSSTNVTTSGTEAVGGLVGNSAGAISQSYSQGTVSGTGSFGGGLVGEITDAGATVDNSYSWSSVSGSETTGGLVGSVTSGAVDKSYSMGSVSATTTAGGLVGVVGTGTVTASFWDTVTSGQGTSAGGNGKNTTEMRTQSTFVAWDFINLWNIAVNQYPEHSLLSNNSTPTAPGTLAFNERFEAAGVDETWNGATIDASNVFDDDALPSSVNSPSGWGSQCLKVDIDGSNGAQSFRDVAVSPVYESSWYSFEVIFTDFGSLNDNAALATTWDTTFTNVIWSSRIKKISTDHRLNFQIYHDGTANEFNYPVTGSINLDQRYKVEVRWDSVMDIWSIRVNGQEISSGSLSGPAVTRTIGQQSVGTITTPIISGPIYYIDRFIVGEPLLPAVMTKDVEAIHTLTYSDDESQNANSCEIFGLINAKVTSPCQCAAGTCQVGITGNSGYTGAAQYDYRVKVDGQDSNTATVNLDIQ